MSVSLRNPRTGQIKAMPEGWSWGCCIGSGILGLPLFRRGLHVWGASMVAFNLVALIVQFLPGSRAATLNGWLTVIGIGLCIFLGMKANAMAIDHLLLRGWDFADAHRAWTETRRAAGFRSAYDR